MSFRSTAPLFFVAHLLTVLGCATPNDEKGPALSSAEAQTSCASAGPSPGNDTRAAGTIRVAQTPTMVVPEGELTAGRSGLPAGVYLVTGVFSPMGVSLGVVHSWVAGVNGAGVVVAQTALNGSNAEDTHVGPQLSGANFQENPSTYAWSFYAIAGIDVDTLRADIPKLEAAWRANHIEFSPDPVFPVDKPRANCNTYSQYVLLAEGVAGIPLEHARVGAEVLSRTPDNGVRHLGRSALELPCLGSRSPALAARCVSAGIGVNDVCASNQSPPPYSQLAGNLNFTFNRQSQRCAAYEAGGEHLWTCRADDSSALYTCYGDVEYRFPCTD